MKAGRFLIALLFVTGLVGEMVKGAVIYSRFLYFSILISVVAWVWTHWAASGLRLYRVARVQRANVGEIFEEKFEVENKSRMFVPWVEVLNQSRIPFASGSRLLTLMTIHQKRTYIARTWLTRRGSFPLGPTRLTTGDPFGLFSVIKEVPPVQTLIVYPLIFEIQSFLFPLGLLPGGQAIRRKSAEITPYATGVREYVHGDAMKRIHWPTSVRRNHLMVKEFEQEPQAELWLYLDSQKDVHFEKPHQYEDIPVEFIFFGRRLNFQMPPSTLEYSISITASLAHYFIAQHRAVGYVSAGQAFTVHSADRSERQEAKILETLAFVEADGNMSISALVAAQASQLPQGSSVILVTPTVRPDLLLAVDDLQRRRLRPVVVLLNAETFSGKRGTDTLVLSLRERRVPVCVIACDADLTQALSELPSDLTSQEMRTWRNPVLSH